MSNFDIIIPLGNSCNITFLLQNCKLKKYTTLFEQFITKNIHNITNVLLKIINNNDHDIIKVFNNHIYIEDNNIFSGHYTIDEFIPIYKRRRDRLLECIKNNNNILFVRFDYDNEINNKDIDDFQNAIKNINININNMKLLIISNNDLKLIHPFLINEIYDSTDNDSYCKEEKINKFFLNTLQKVGYNINNVSDISFTINSDKSII